MAIDIRDATVILTGLANEMRLSIFRMLVAEGGMSAGELAETLSISPSNLSFHLKDLYQAGLVSREKKGRQVIYAANFDNLNDLLSYLVDDCCGGRPELCIKTVEPKSICCSKSA